MKKPSAVPAPAFTIEAGYLSLKALAVYSGLSVRTLRGRLTDPVHPLPHYRFPNKLLVRKSDFDAWVQRFRVMDAGRGAVALGALVDDVMAGLR